ncbi:MAG: Mov34/MPN/PAD-1 family protein [Candidatus Nezhaarchaeales archaeon]
MPLIFRKGPSAKLREVVFSREMIEGLFCLAKENHPREIFLLLRGEVRGSSVYVDELIYPINTIFGLGFSEFQPHNLPLDPSIIGSVHSHPSGSSSPSTQDLHNFFGIVMVILAYPYNLASTSAYDKSGNPLIVRIVNSLEFRT